MKFKVLNKIKPMEQDNHLSRKDIDTGHIPYYYTPMEQILIKQCTNKAGTSQ